MSTRPVPVPRTVETMHAVMTPVALEREDRLPLPHDALLRHHGTSESALARLRERPHQVVLHTRTPAETAREDVVRARVAALELAAEHDGLVIELRTPRVLELEAADVSATHATQWYVLDATALGVGQLVTNGLGQFGLPELRLDGVEPALHAMPAAVLAGLAHRLIAEWPENDPVGPATVTLRDVAFGLGDSQATTTPPDRGVRLDIAYASDERLLDVALLDDPARTLFA